VRPGAQQAFAQRFGVIPEAAEQLRAEAVEVG
jgi:hypothetical protein